MIEMNEKLYVCGFCFSADRERVVLIKRKQPSWCGGYINGVGGKVEDAERVSQQHEMAMAREFKEETGLEVPSTEWKLFTVMYGTGYVVYFYKAFLPGHVLSKHFESFDMGLFETDEGFTTLTLYNRILKCKELVPNLKWLMPMALDDSIFYNALKLCEGY